MQDLYFEKNNNNKNILFILNGCTKLPLEQDDLFQPLQIDLKDTNLVIWKILDNLQQCVVRQTDV